MDMQETAMQMSELLQVNEGSVKVYDEALQKVEDQQDLRQQLQQFRNDHQKHVQDIQGWFRQSGQRQMQTSEEFQNLLQTALEDVRMARGRDEVLKAMTIAEALDNAEYGEAAKANVQGDVQQLIQQQLNVEHRHWQFVEQYSPLKVMASAGMMGGGQSYGTGGGSMGGGGMGGGSMGGGSMGGGSMGGGSRGGY